MTEERDGENIIEENICEQDWGELVYLWHRRASDVVQQVKVSAVKTWQPEFKPPNWNKSGMRELTPWM